MSLSPRATELDFAVRLALMVSLVILWPSWVSRAYANLGDVFESNTARSSTMAVLVHFIPIVNLVKPYEVFCEMWSLVAPEPRREDRALLRGWWGVWLSSLFYFQFNATLSAMLPGSFSQTLLTILDIVLFPSACLLSALVIMSITSFQLEYWRARETAHVFE